MHLIIDAEDALSLCTAGFMAFLVVDPKSLLLLLPFEPCFRVAAFDPEIILDSVLIASELLSIGEQLPPHPLGA